ncbi:hypothetical protein So717_13300 [Roseobacter cerasinus]|uniref:Flagellar biosynthesis protein n=1 Tax=Roseobacter cerasinus TaxID=2602289 RepID=A0A640VPB1_9RHOB|nr:ABC transporter ATP-binding protein [Roseobacter cerasinus]GFE49577.1 hypothetical protein So717_13300 [Roseobacter cerasinus]
MSLSHRYKNFNQPSEPEPVESPVNVALTEDQQLEAFEKGYQAGWDDAVKAQSDSVSKVSAEFGQNLQDMSFSYHEALSKLTLSVQPILTDIIDKILPEVARGALAPQIVEQLMDPLKDAASQPVEIVVAQSNLEAVQSLAEDRLKAPFEIVVEPSLADGQAFVRIGNEERNIDLQAVLSGVRDAMTAFFHETEQETLHG